MSQRSLLRRPAPASDVSRDHVIEVLSNQRRRYTLHLLKRRDGAELSLRELAEQIASWENDTTPAEITYQERRRVHNALRQYHLPKLADAGLVDYDADERTVSLTEPARRHQFYLDVLPHRGLPWGLYYLTITTVAGVCLIGAVLQLGPLTMLAPAQWVIFFGVVLWVSSIAHAYDNLYQMRLGRGHQPTEPESP